MAAPDAIAAANEEEADDEDEGVKLLKKYHARVKDKASSANRKAIQDEQSEAEAAMKTAEDKDDHDAAVQAYSKALLAKSKLKKFPSEEGLNALDGKLKVVTAATRAYKDAEKAYKDQLTEVEQMLGMQPSPAWVSAPVLEVRPCRICEERPREVRMLPCNHSIACVHCTVKSFSTKSNICMQCRQLVTSVRLNEEDKDDPSMPPTPLALKRQQTFKHASTEDGISLKDFFSATAAEALDMNEKCKALITRLENGELNSDLEEDEEDMGFDLFD